MVCGKEEGRKKERQRLNEWLSYFIQLDHSVTASHIIPVPSVAALLSSLDSIFKKFVWEARRGVLRSLQSWQWTVTLCPSSAVLLLLVAELALEWELQWPASISKVWRSKGVTPSVCENIATSSFPSRVSGIWDCCSSASPSASPFSPFNISHKRPLPRTRSHPPPLLFPPPFASTQISSSVQRPFRR